MKIQIDPHTLERAEERGATKDEIIDVIQHGFSTEAKYKRKSRAKIYPYDKNRGRKYYAQKRVEVVYLYEKNAIVTVTVYVFYGKWET